MAEEWGTALERRTAAVPHTVTYVDGPKAGQSESFPHKPPRFVRRASSRYKNIKSKSGMQYKAPKSKRYVFDGYDGDPADCDMIYRLG